MSDSKAHRAAVAQTLSWARAAAARGDHADALAWLATLDAIGHPLSREDQYRRAAWRDALVARCPAEPPMVTGAAARMRLAAAGDR